MRTCSGVYLLYANESGYTSRSIAVAHEGNSERVSEPWDADAAVTQFNAGGKRGFSGELVDVFKTHFLRAAVHMG